MRVVRVAGRDERGDLDLPSLEADLDHRHLGIGVGLFDPQIARALRADQRGVVPSELGDRVGQLLEPAVVGVAAVVELRIRHEDDLEGASVLSEGTISFSWMAAVVKAASSFSGSGAGALLARKPSWRNFTHPAVRSFTPAVAAKPRNVSCTSSGPLRLRQAGDARQQIELRPAAVEREDHRLDRDVAAVGREAVAPMLEVMRLRHLPGDARGAGWVDRGLIDRAAEPDDCRDG